MQTVKQVLSVLSGQMTKEARAEACKTIGQQIDKWVIEHTEESKALVKEIFVELKAHQITCLLGAQVHHLIQAEPKYGKEHIDHYKTYLAHHYHNWKSGILIPTVDQLFPN